MGKLSRKEIDDLELRVQKGDALGYWEILAKQKDVDNYPKTNANAIKNENEGKFLNHFAKAEVGASWNAESQQSTNEAIMRRDFEQRKRYSLMGKSEEALNLPAEDVMRTQHEGRREKGSDGYAWAPYGVLMAAQRNQQNGADSESINPQQDAWREMMGDRGMATGRGNSVRPDEANFNLENNLGKAGEKYNAPNSWFEQFNQASKAAKLDQNNMLSPNHIYHHHKDLSGSHYKFFDAQPGNPKKNIPGEAAHWQQNHYIQNPYTNKIIEMPGSKKVTDENLINQLNGERGNRLDLIANNEEELEKAKNLLAQASSDDLGRHNKATGINKKAPTANKNNSENNAENSTDKLEAAKTEPMSPAARTALQNADKQGLPQETKEALFNHFQMRTFKETREQHQQKEMQTQNRSNTDRFDMVAGAEAIQVSRDNPTQNQVQSQGQSHGAQAIGGRV